MTWPMIVLASVLAADAPAPRRPLHPPVAVSRRRGSTRGQVGRPVSTLRTCGTCHDTAYIAGHSYHAAAGTDHPFAPGTAPSGRPWDIGAGLFGRWDALGHGPAGPVVDLKAWLATTAARHIGGGPAGRWVWRWTVSSVTCRNPTSRPTAPRGGRYKWAATATLAATGVARRTEKGWDWDPEGFPTPTDTSPTPSPGPAPPRHGGELRPLPWRGFPRGHLAADAGHRPRRLEHRDEGPGLPAQMLKDSGLNLAGKDGLARPFDVHAERLLQCADRHSTANNPAQFAAVAKAGAGHLSFEPRRLTPGEYLAGPTTTSPGGTRHRAPSPANSTARCGGASSATTPSRRTPGSPTRAGTSRP